MDFKERKSFIYEQLAKEIRVAVQYDGYVNENLKEVFDSYASTNNLSKFSDIKDECGRVDHENHEIYKPLLGQVSTIEKALSERSDILAKNSMVTNVDLAKVPASRFERLARRFESESKDALVVTSPNQFL